MKSVRTKLVGLVVTSLFIVLGGYSALLFINLKEIIVSNQEEHLSGLAVVACNNAALWLDGKQKEMLAVADSISVASDDLPSIIARLKTHAENNPAYEMVFYADTNGSAVTSSGFKTTIADRPYFQNVLNTGRTVVSNPVISRESDHPIVAIAAPVKQGRHITGIVGCTISLQYLSQLINGITPMGTGYAFVLQSDGTTIIHPDNELVLQHNILNDPAIDLSLKDAAEKMTRQESGVTTYIYDNVPKYLAFEPIPRSRWSLGINVPKDEVLGQLSPVYRLIIVTPLFVIIVATTVISLLLIVFIVRPITNLKTMMSRVEEGDLDVWVDHKSPDEVGQLTESFNRMVQTIKQGREIILRSEEQYRLLFESAGESIVIAQDGMLKLVNEKTKELTGYSGEELTSRPFIEFIHRDDRNLVLDRHIQRLSGYGEQQKYSFRIIHRSGAMRWGEISAVRIEWDGADATLNFLNDITDRKRVEEKMIQQADAMDAAIDGMALLNEEGQYVYLNKAHVQLYGYEHTGELLGKSWKILYDSGELQRFEATVIPEIHKSGSWQGEALGMKKDGSTFNQELSLTALDHGGLICIVRDITRYKRTEEEREKLREQLNRVERLDSIGTLAGGIAHDFNNLLMGIQGNAVLMMNDVDSSHPHYKRLKSIEEHVSSGAELTGQLLGFSRGGRYHVKPVSIDTIIKKSSSMFGRTKKELSIHEKYSHDPCIVEVDSAQLEQVFMNLFVNAWQAMPNGGDICVETQRAVLTKGEVLYDDVKPGSYVKVTVTDSGTGMDKTTIDRIFDPFFTTKAMGRGTGLGLATAYGIIKGHGGMITVNSEPGRGTTFTLYIPASDKDPEEEQKTTESLLRGTETILLVDDEKMILDVSMDMLKSLGYHVYAVESVQEAIDLYKEKKSEIDMVIMDMIMPGISGRGFFDQLKAINPDVKVLLASGYSIKGQAQAIINQGCDGFIQKPFLLEKLSQSVRKVLG